LQSDVVAYRGQPIALVVADSLEIAHEAAAPVEVEYETAPFTVELSDPNTETALQARKSRLGSRTSFAETPIKRSNAGGGKGPQFKTDAICGEGHGDWATYQLQESVQKLRMALHAKANA
jgi:CO/xanthine dehydrogenase Mo-binding subunit